VWEVVVLAIEMPANAAKADPVASPPAMARRVARDRPARGLRGAAGDDELGDVFDMAVNLRGAGESTAEIG
jgi:hypothetical protein